MKPTFARGVSMFALLACLILPGAAGAAEFPQEGFFLYFGKLPAAADETPDYKADTVAFKAIAVWQRDGRLSVDETVPVSFDEPVGAARYQGKVKYDGTETITIDGDYDKDTGALTGRVSVQRKLTSVKSWVSDGKPVSEAPQFFESGGKGLLKGQMVEGRALVKFAFTDGKVRSNRQVEYLVSTFTPDSGWLTEQPEATPTDEQLSQKYGGDYGKDSGARFSGMNGEIEWRAGDKPDDWHLCKLDTVIPVGAHVRAAEGSSAVIGFGDMSTVVMKPETEIVIALLTKKDLKMSLISHDVWVNVRKMIKTGSMEVEMNQAVAGIKGTTFVASEDGGTSTLKLIEGSAELTSRKTGEMTTVSGGQAASVGADGKITTAPFDVMAEIAAWDGLTTTDWKAMDRVPEPDAGSAPGSAEPAAKAAGSASGRSPVIAVVVVLALAAAGAAFFVLRRR